MDVAARSEHEHFTRRFIAQRNEADPRRPSEEMLRSRAILEAFQRSVAEWVSVKSRLRPEDIEFEASLMVYDETITPGKTGTLRTAVATLMTDPDIWNFNLEIGDGNAGRAYKYNFLRMSFPRDSSALPPAYLPAGSRKHGFICSIPLRHPESARLIMGVLNIGSFSSSAARACRCLQSVEGVAWLAAKAHQFVLTRLMQEMLPRFTPVNMVIRNVKHAQFTADTSGFSFHIIPEALADQTSSVHLVIPSGSPAVSPEFQNLKNEEDRILVNLRKVRSPDWEETRIRPTPPAA